VRAWENLNPWEGYDEPQEEPVIQPSGQFGGAPAESGGPNRQKSNQKEEAGLLLGGEAFAVFAADVGERLAANEIRELEKCAARAEEDREQFNERMVRFYGRHRDYACRALAPLLRACARNGGTPDEEGVVAAVVDESVDLLSTTPSPADVLNAWRDNRAQELQDIILKGLGYERQAA